MSWRQFECEFGLFNGFWWPIAEQVSASSLSCKPATNSTSERWKVWLAWEGAQIGDCVRTANDSRRLLQLRYHKAKRKHSRRFRQCKGRPGRPNKRMWDLVLIQCYPAPSRAPDPRFPVRMSCPGERSVLSLRVGELVTDFYIG